jgi:hypothetical protein
MKKALITISILVVLAFVVYTQLTLFVVPPIGAVPEGRTIVMLRLENIQFIDSPDAVCERLQGGVNLLCRAAVLGGVAENATVIANWPYSESLYLISTGGKKYGG